MPILKKTIFFREETTLIFCPIQIKICRCFVGERKTEKNFRSKEGTINKFNPHMAPGQNPLERSHHYAIRAASETCFLSLMKKNITVTLHTLLILSSLL